MDGRGKVRRTCPKRLNQRGSGSISVRVTALLSNQTRSRFFRENRAWSACNANTALMPSHLPILGGVRLSAARENIYSCIAKLRPGVYPEDRNQHREKHGLQ